MYNILMHNMPKSSATVQAVMVSQKQVPSKYCSTYVTRFRGYMFTVLLSAVVEIRVRNRSAVFLRWAIL